MNELKPEDVMRALECHSLEDISTCDNCPYCDISVQGSCGCDMAKDALAILREKDAEIERLTAYNANLICANTDITNRHKDYVEEAERIARADAITEFAERLYPLHKVLCVDDGDWRNEVDKIAKEMKEAHQ